MKTTYTEEALADIIDAIEYLNGRNPTAAAKLDDDLARCIQRLAGGEFDGPQSRFRSGAVVRSWAVPPFRIYYQRHSDELLIVRAYAGRPMKVIKARATSPAKEPASPDAAAPPLKAAS